jgi:uncharacterized phage protein (TIGR01671 family)
MSVATRKAVTIMREILFRGKTSGNEWKYGNLSIVGDVCFISEDMGFNKNVIPETVGQYTGLTDKNGKKIFEGDICRFREWSKGDMCWIGKVHYEHQQCVISGNPNKECESEFLLVLSRFIPENIEIIGNIHDNPELLEGETNA